MHLVVSGLTALAEHGWQVVLTGGKGDISKES